MKLYTYLKITFYSKKKLLDIPDEIMHNYIILHKYHQNNYNNSKHLCQRKKYYAAFCITFPLL